MNEQKQQNTSAPRMADKIRLSMVLKLNMHMLGRLFSAFLAMDILLCILLFGIATWRAEQGAQALIQPFDATFYEAGLYTSEKNYTIEKLDEPINQDWITKLFAKYLPVKTDTAQRRVMIAKTYKNSAVFEKITAVEYRIAFESNGVSYEITYSLGKDLYQYQIILLVLFASQLLIFLGSIGKGTRAIRRTLRPLSEMAQTARDINAGVSYFDPAKNYAHIKDLTGAISSIDEYRLDRRISMDSSQNELKDLAGAINDLLNRISQAYRSQVRFVSDASHELRTPISVIQGYANLLDRWGKNDEKTMQESIEAIKSEAENMKQLVEQLLFLARGDNETMQLQPVVFDVSDIAEEIMKETQMIDTTHSFRTTLEPQAYIYADQQLIKQAIRILMDNSIKYTPKGEEIVLSVAKQQDTVRISVQDNGIGIAPEDIPHIFDRFYRSDESRARKTGGSGLGLAIAKWIFDRHGGRVEVLSRKDIGTRTTIILTAVEKQ